ncbi:Anthranilate N-benzoyltransferase protein 1 [Nymphaea thermarum]|nr:Anthranilate N-benzoyltransferase protein 1 [Nymphaea thermarum]
MKIKIESSRLVKPSYESPTHPATDVLIPLSLFDSVTFDTHVGGLYVYRPPTPPNRVIEQGLRKALVEYREWAGRFVYDADDRRCIILNDEGLPFVEASSEYPLGSILDEPSPHHLDLHPSLDNPDFLAQVQLTRFACGTLVVAFTSHHMVADGLATSGFIVAWGRATRGLPMDPLPLHDRSIFVPRDPPRFQFQHRGVEYVDRRAATKHSDPEDTIVVHKARFPHDFVAKLKSAASVNSPYTKPFTTFECVMAHLWRKITSARGLSGKETTKVKIAVNGRSRMSNPSVPMRHFGNVVLWAVPQSRVEDLLAKPVGHAAALIHDAVARVDDDYFRSFIDFSSSKEKMEGLVPSADKEEMVLSPDLEVDCWLKFPYYGLDFGTGSPYLFVPSHLPVEGLLIIVPSLAGVGDIDVYVPLFEKNVDSFKNGLFSLD